MKHELKAWPQFFGAVLDGSKTFEIRRDDRGYAVGDTLWLREWDPATEEYSGRAVTALVTYLLGADQHCAVSPVAINRPYVVMAITEVRVS